VPPSSRSDFDLYGVAYFVADVDAPGGYRRIPPPDVSPVSTTVAMTCECGQPLVGFAGSAARCVCGALWILGSPMRIA